MEQITIELPTPIINALTAYTEGEQISSSDTIKTALESFLTAKGYLSQPQKSFHLTPASQGSGHNDTSIHHLSLSSDKQPSHLQHTLKFAGSWNDLTDEEFTAFLDEVTLRRQQAFTERRNHETFAD